jgi:hypothetical protein
MAILFGTPSHAVVDPEPRFGKVWEPFPPLISCFLCLSNIQVLRFFRFRDYATVATATALSVPVGYIFGEMRRAPARLKAFILLKGLQLQLSIFLSSRTSHSWPCIIVCRRSWLNRRLHRCVPKL